MDYFMERSNPFYDRTCNNESIKMQRLNMEQLRYKQLKYPIFNLYFII